MRAGAGLLLLALASCGGGGSGGGGMPAPSSLSYHQPPAFTVGKAITPLAPSVTGQVNRYDVSPALPQGLIINVTTGVISGIPVALAAQGTYVVSASNTGGSTTASVTIVVNNVSPAIVYPSAYFGLTANVAVVPIVPTASGGAVVSWSVNPALPPGLTLNNDGSISGTPTAATAAASYKITASNSGGPSSYTLTIAVSGAPLLRLGLAANVTVLRYVGSSVLSQDQHYNWLLQNYTTGATLASGIGSGAPVISGSGQYVDLEASIMIDDTLAALEVRSATTGQLMVRIPAPTAARWYRLSTDGSYVVAGSPTALSVWASTSGQLLFARAGDYSQAVPFAAPGQVQLAMGAAGAAVIETVSVPGGASSVSPSFSGTFDVWFSDGQRFITTLGTTVWTYSAAGVQQDITTAGVPQGGEGNWWWTFDQSGTDTLNIYQVGNSATPTFTGQYGSLANLVPSGSTLGVLEYGPQAGGPWPLIVIDLSGAAPTSTTFSIPFADTGAFAASSPSQWLVGNGEGVIYDGASPAGQPRTLTLGAVRSVAAGTLYISVATASGQVLFFNASDDSAAGTLNFPSELLVASADGSVLGAGAYGGISNETTLQIYNLPSTTAVATFPYSLPNTALANLTMSGTGTEVGELFNPDGGVCLTQVIQTNGTVILCSNATDNALVGPYEVDSVQLSPDGTLIAFSLEPTTTIATSIYKNGTLVTAVPGWAIGWIDNNHLLTQSYIQDMATSGALVPNSTAIYDAQGHSVGATPFAIIGPFQTVSASGLEIFDRSQNKILSLTSGATLWASPYPLSFAEYQFGIGANLAAITGTQVVFASNNLVLAESY